jgi:hypothetical protein
MGSHGSPATAAVAALGQPIAEDGVGAARYNAAIAATTAVSGSTSASGYSETSSGP